MDKVRLIFRMGIPAGGLGRFKAIAASILAVVEQKGPETLEYEWFLNREQTECVVLETFASSEALLAHAEMISGLAMELFELCDVQLIWLCGNASAAVLEKTAAFGPTHYALLQGKSAAR